MTNISAKFGRQRTRRNPGHVMSQMIDQLPSSHLAIIPASAYERIRAGAIPLYPEAKTQLQMMRAKT
jgi:hypothetical protein